MLFSLGVIILVSLVLGFVFNKLKLPTLLGFLFTGILLGPDLLNLIDPSILNISAELRRIALIIILTRAGLSLDIDNLKANGRAALLMSFVPACFEIAGITLLTHFLIDLPILDGMILGSVLAAVSPAVLVPRMIKIKQEGYNPKVPELLMAGSSVDDIFVIIIFTSLTNLAVSNEFSFMTLLNIPISIILGIMVGIAVGGVLNMFFKKVHIRDSIKVIIFLAVSFLLVTAEDVIGDIIPYSGLLSIMFIGIILNHYYKPLAVRLESKYNKLWVLAEILLFTLVGAIIDIQALAKAGLITLVIILLGLVFRIIGVKFCLIKTKFSKNERKFISIAYLPKATVQAALCSIPLALGLEVAPTVLTFAVLAIIVTASLGAVLIDNTYKKWLTK